MVKVVGGSRDRGGIDGFEPSPNVEAAVLPFTPSSPPGLQLGHGDWLEGRQSGARYTT